MLLKSLTVSLIQINAVSVDLCDMLNGNESHVSDIHV